MIYGLQLSIWNLEKHLKFPIMEKEKKIVLSK